MKETSQFIQESVLRPQYKHTKTWQKAARGWWWNRGCLNAKSPASHIFNVVGYIGYIGVVGDTPFPSTFMFLHLHVHRIFEAHPNHPRRKAPPRPAPKSPKLRKAPGLEHCCHGQPPNPHLKEIWKSTWKVCNMATLVSVFDSRFWLPWNKSRGNELLHSARTQRTGQNCGAETDLLQTQFVWSPTQ